MSDGARREISLMFSGGVDSTVAALHLAERYDRIHLLTYANGPGQYGLSRARRRAEELQARFPGRVVYVQRSVRALFERLALRTIEEDYATYRSGFIWCLGCKLAMHVHSAGYARAHGISRHTDGSSAATDEMVEQMPVALAAVRRFYQDHDLDFVPTDYHMARDDKRALLTRAGFRMGIPVRDRYLGIQPSCIPGELYYLPFVLLGRRPDHPEDRVAAYIEAKRPIMDALLAGGGLA